jgi:NDP-sugar pyrophosphorylase family protein
MDAPLRDVLRRKAGSRFERPITARAGTDLQTCFQLIQQHRVLHLPLVDELGRPVGLMTQEDFLPHAATGLQAFVMAGGAGTRLLPLTEELPKPMLPIGDRPLMEILIARLRDAGIRRVNVSLNYKGDRISNHFGDGTRFGVDLRYVTEDRPLGTAGALGLVEPPKDTVLVINGDILTQIDFRAMLNFHREHSAELTMAVRQCDLQVRYGVVECTGVKIEALCEKPVFNLFVNAGIYLLEPAVYQYIPNGTRFDMTDLVQRLLDEGRPVCGFPIREYWLDIGQRDDYDLAQRHAAAWRAQA